MNQEKFFFSASTTGFYLLSIHGAQLPVDAVEITGDEHAALLDGQSKGKVIASDGRGYPVLVDPPPPTPEEVIAGMTAAVQQHLDVKARERNYDGILSLCTYATSPNPKFAAEGQAGVEWRDAVWVKCYEVLAEVEAGLREQPTVEQLIAELPVIVWPD